MKKYKTIVVSLILAIMIPILSSCKVEDNSGIDVISNDDPILSELITDVTTTSPEYAQYIIRELTEGEIAFLESRGAVIFQEAYECETGTVKEVYYYDPISEEDTSKYEYVFWEMKSNMSMSPTGFKYYFCIPKDHSESASAGSVSYEIYDADEVISIYDELTEHGGEIPQKIYICNAGFPTEIYCYDPINEINDSNYQYLKIYNPGITSTISMAHAIMYYRVPITDITE